VVVGFQAARLAVRTKMAGVLTRRPWRAARAAADFELHLDPAVVKSDDTARVRSLLESALAPLKPARGRALACVVSIERVCRVAP
jgi:hypothetical protein